MKSLFSKVILGSAGFFLVIYAARQFLFAAFVHLFLSRGEFEYESKRWENGALVYENVAAGVDLKASQIRLTPHVELFPFHASLDLYLAEPHINLDFQSLPPLLSS